MEIEATDPNSTELLQPYLQEKSKELSADLPEQQINTELRISQAVIHAKGSCLDEGMKSARVHWLSVYKLFLLPPRRYLHYLCVTNKTQQLRMIKCFSTCTSGSRYAQSPGACTHVRGMGTAQEPPRCCGHRGQRRLPGGKAGSCLRRIIKATARQQLIKYSPATCLLPMWLQKWQIIPRKCTVASLTWSAVLGSTSWYVTTPQSPFLQWCPHRDTPQLPARNAEHKLHSEVLNQKRSKPDYYTAKGA